MSKEQEQRESVIREALTWQGTPHHNGARLKGIGVDCGQFPIAVYSSCGLMPAITPGYYPPDFHFHRDREWYLELAQKYGREVAAPTGPGDFALFKFGRIFSHGAIIVDTPKIIHSYVQQGVVLARLDQGDLVGRDVKFFTLWGE